MHFTVDRKTWNRGRPFSVQSSLLNNSGMMCCLGHLGLACHVDPFYMLGIGLPFVIGVNQSGQKEFAASIIERSKFPEELSANSQVNLANINDDMHISDETREQLLTEAFLKIGITVEFIN